MGLPGRNRRHGCRLVLLTVFALSASPVDADDGHRAGQVLAASGVGAGVCAHIGCGLAGSPGLTAELAARSSLLVHGICWDSASLARARAPITARKVTGQASVEKIDGGALPYVRHLCNLIVVEDMQILAANGIGRDELMRILAPRGILCTLENGRWTKTVGPRPEGMDDWTHPHHAPDGNLVSNDRLLRFPIGLRWIAGLPKSINAHASVRGWVLAGGRCYIVSSSVAENLAPGIKDKTHYLVCRDAYNGLELWRLPLGTSESGSGLYWRNVSPLAADDKRVYAVGKGKVMIVNGATGEVEHTIKPAYAPERLILMDNTLVLSCWDNRDWTKAPFERQGGAGPWVNTTNKGSVEAYDAGTGKRLWKLDVPAFSVFGANGVVYLLTRDANPAAANDVIAMDVRSGEERWRVGHKALGDKADLQLDLVGPGFVVISKRATEELKVLSSATGELLWSKQYASVRPGHWKDTTSYRFTALVNGQLWCSSYRYEPLTGELLGKLPADVPRVGLTICVSPIIVGNVFCHSRRCKYVELRDTADGSEPLRSITFNAARGACIQGMTPANGMFYTAQNHCGCEPGQILGFLGFGPNGDFPAETVFAHARPVERGAAFADAGAGPIDPEAWPMQRANADRSGITAAQAPETLEILWEASVAGPNSGPMQAAWDERLAPVVTPPVVAGGRVFVAGTETGQVKAFDVASGKPSWTVALGSRIDSAPTILGNLCVVGSHDGWVYAFTADSGALVWRTRVAPVEQRIVVNGRVESTWPAVGSVLAHDGKLVANAGRGTETDGGIAVVQIDPATGRTLWAGVIGPGSRRRIDLLYVADGAVACNETVLAPLSGTSRTQAAKARPPAGPMLDAYLGRAGLRGFSASNSRAIAGEHTVTAMASPPGGRIRVAAKATDAQIATIELSVAPICDGLAVADGRVFVALEDGKILCLGGRR